MTAVSLFDTRTFFEKSLVHGVRNGIIPPEKVAAINAEAPKGIVQIARYFGSEFLRPELEKAKDRMLNLISLHLEHSSGGDLQKAAESLRDHSLLSRSKGGADMLKSLIAMPQTSHFGMHEVGGFGNHHIPLLATWALRPLNDYQEELVQRRQVALVLESAIWLANSLGLNADDLVREGPDAGAVIRTALLLHTLKRTQIPDWVAFEKMVMDLRKKYPQAKAPKSPKPITASAADPEVPTIEWPQKLPEHFKPAIECVRQSVLRDLPKLLDAQAPPRKLFSHTSAFTGRYFWVGKTY